MVVVVLGTHLVLEYAAQRDIRQVLDERSQTVVDTLGETDPRSLSSDDLQPGMVVYVSGVRVAGSLGAALQDAADDLATSRRVRLVSTGDDEDQLLATPFTTRDGTTGVLVASEETGPYELSELYALLASVVLGVLVVAATGVMAWRVTAQALKPVTVMAERASEWSEHDLERRFDLGDPTDELRALGHTLDGLLGKVARAIRAEQRLTSELAHELRSPLTAIAGTAELIAMRPDLDDQLREDVEDSKGKIIVKAGTAIDAAVAKKIAATNLALVKVSPRITDQIEMFPLPLPDAETGAYTTHCLIRGIRYMPQPFVEQRIARLERGEPLLLLWDAQNEVAPNAVAPPVGEIRLSSSPGPTPSACASLSPTMM